ncbi:unnamed protein product [Discula destructiva]
MLKPRLRLPLGHGLLRAYPAQARSSPFARAAAVASMHQEQDAAPSGLVTMPPLAFGDKFQSEGVHKLYTPVGFQFAWTDYQAWCIHMLNQEIAGTPLQDKKPYDIALITSREAHLAAIFNYASMAHNNHFYFDSIASNVTKGKDGEDVDATPYEHMPAELRQHLDFSFGSLENLRTEMLGQADAMFGPGFVWLVRLKNHYGMRARPYRVLTTYLAGSPYPEAHWRKQGMDMNSVAGNHDKVGSVVNEYYNMQNRANNRPPVHGSDVDALDALDAHKARNPNWADVLPVLCVNTWEHAWLADWGVGNKGAFLDAWWRAVNWGVVGERALTLGNREMTDNPKLPTTESGYAPGEGRLGRWNRVDATGALS